MELVKGSATSRKSWTWTRHPCKDLSSLAAMVLFEDYHDIVYSATIDLGIEGCGCSDDVLQMQQTRRESA